MTSEHDAHCDGCRELGVLAERDEWMHRAGRAEAKVAAIVALADRLADDPDSAWWDHAAAGKIRDALTLSEANHAEM